MEYVHVIFNISWITSFDTNSMKQFTSSSRRSSNIRTKVKWIIMVQF